jgi:hypothetical protein
LSVSLAELPKEAPQAGDRFPWLCLKLQPAGKVQDLFETLDDMHFHLIVVGQPNPLQLSKFDDLFRVHMIPADAANDAELKRARIPSPSFYLLRPDGHVGLCGLQIDTAAVERYLREKLGLKSAQPAE